MSDAELLRAAARLGIAHLEGLSVRHVGARAPQGELAARLGGALPETGADAMDVITALATAAEGGLVASPGPRYYGFVTGGAVPVTVAADWLVSAWDQNGAAYAMSPAVAVMEQIVSAWVLDLLGLPAQASVGFVTGAHMANFTCLAAARHEVLRRVGWNVEEDGLQDAPAVSVIVGDDAHVSVIGALRMLGFGARQLHRVGVDGQGRMRVDDFERVLAAVSGPTIVCVQAGNVSTGASDPIGAIAASARRLGAWVHVDGAFGLWAAAVPGRRSLVAGLEQADSWTTDAHKWLNVPYDSGLAIVSNAAPHRAAMSLRASYLPPGGDTERIGMDWVPESSRRARVVPLYALLRTLGRRGVQDMIERTCTLAQRFARQLENSAGVSVLNEVVLNQILVRFADSDDVTQRVIGGVQADGTCWAGGARWQGQQVMRISVSNWSTTEQDIDRSAAAIVKVFRDVSSE